jgi:hypothetical protein
MINSRFCPTAFLLLAFSFGTAFTALAGDVALRFQATLVWGTNNPEPEGSELKPVAPAVSRKLGKLPFKWKYYYTVHCEEFSVPQGKRKKVRMSEECEIVVKAIDGEKVELALLGRGEPVGRVTQKLSSDHMLVTGGNAENLTAWFVVLRRPD